MNLNIAAALVAASQDSLELYEDYIGRGRNKPTAGVTGSDADFRRALVNFYESKIEEREMLTALRNDEYLPKHKEELEEMKKAIDFLSTDNLGRDIIFY